MSNDNPDADLYAEALEAAAWVVTNGISDSDVELAIEGADPNDPLIIAVRAIMDNRCVLRASFCVFALR